MGCFNNLGKFGDNVAAVSAEGLKITYNELQNFSDKIGKVIEKRTLVFCLCQNTIGSMAGYISFLSNDIVPLMVDANINDVLMNNLLDVYCPQYVYAPMQMKDSFDKYEVVFEEYNYCVLKTNFDKYYELNDDLAMLLTTSGSTGSPKLVRQSYKNIVSNAQAIAQYLELNKDERPITTLPMNYTYGISIIN